MKTLILEDLNLEEKVPSNEKASLIYLPSGDILKLFGSLHQEYDFLSKIMDDKITFLQGYKNIPELVIPNAKVYSERTNSLIGYTMPKVEGVSFPKYHGNLKSSKLRNINFLTDLYLRIEDMIKKLNENGIVVPDLCTLDNIMINANKSMRLIDCDGWQVSKYQSTEISSLLGEQNQYLTNKYFDSKTTLFNSNLDKKSLVVIYFISVLGISLEESIVYMQQLYNCSSISQIIEMVFDKLGLSDLDFQHKIWKLYQENEENEYIGEDVKRIADNYVLEYSQDSHMVRTFKRK